MNTPSSDDSHSPTNTPRLNTISTATRRRVLQAVGAAGIFTTTATTASADSHDFEDALALHHKLDDTNSDGEIPDASGNDAIGVLSDSNIAHSDEGARFVTDDERGRVLELSGRGKDKEVGSYNIPHANLPSKAEYQGEPLTWSMRIKPDKEHINDWLTICSTSLGCGVNIRRGEIRTIDWHGSGNNFDVGVSVDEHVEGGEWTTVMAAVAPDEGENGKVRLFINGELVKEIDGSNATIKGYQQKYGSKVGIGWQADDNDGGYDGRFEGRLDDVRLYVGAAATEEDAEKVHTDSADEDTDSGGIMPGEQLSVEVFPDPVNVATEQAVGVRVTDRFGAPVEGVKVRQDYSKIDTGSDDVEVIGETNTKGMVSKGVDEAVTDGSYTFIVENEAGETFTASADISVTNTVNADDFVIEQVRPVQVVWNAGRDDDTLLVDRKQTSFLTRIAAPGLDGDENSLTRPSSGLPENDQYTVRVSTDTALTTIEPKNGDTTSHTFDRDEFGAIVDAAWEFDPDNISNAPEKRFMSQVVDVDALTGDMVIQKDGFDRDVKHGETIVTELIRHEEDVAPENGTVVATDQSPVTVWQMPEIQIDFFPLSGSGFPDLGEYGDHSPEESIERTVNFSIEYLRHVLPLPADNINYTVHDEDTLGVGGKTIGSGFSGLDALDKINETYQQLPESEKNNTVPEKLTVPAGIAPWKLTGEAYGVTHPAANWGGNSVFIREYTIGTLAHEILHTIPKLHIGDTIPKTVAALNLKDEYDATSSSVCESQVINGYAARTNEFLLYRETNDNPYRGESIMCKGDSVSLFKNEAAERLSDGGLLHVSDPSDDSFSWVSDTNTDHSRDKLDYTRAAEAFHALQNTELVLSETDFETGTPAELTITADIADNTAENAQIVFDSFEVTGNRNGVPILSRVERKYDGEVVESPVTLNFGSQNKRKVIINSETPGLGTVSLDRYPDSESTTVITRTIEITGEEITTDQDTKQDTEQGTEKDTEQDNTGGQDQQRTREDTRTSSDQSPSQDTQSDAGSDESQSGANLFEEIVDDIIDFF